MLLKLDGANWVKVVPTGSKLFDCNHEYLVTGITTQRGHGREAQLANRVATEFGTFTPK